jgi:hypothetical protein
MNHLQPNYNHVINELQDYMLNEKAISRFISNSFDGPSESKKTMLFQKQPRITNNKVDTFKDPKIILKEKDSLFWSFFIMIHGIVEYEKMQPINLIVEKKWKIEYIEKLRLNKALMKKYKYATLTHIESQLLNETKIDLPTFFSLCVLENLNILYLCKRSYYELKVNSGDPIMYVLHRLDDKPNNKYLKNAYAYEMATQGNITSYYSDYLKIDNLQKPFKAMSSYKLSELTDFCNKLGLETIDTNTNKTKNKKDLYESLIQYF